MRAEVQKMGRVAATPWRTVAPEKCCDMTSMAWLAESRSTVAVILTGTEVSLQRSLPIPQFPII